LERLFAFINGYKNHNSYDVNANDCLDGFNQYVAERYKMDTDHNWSSIIQFFYETEKDAFDEFYKLLDEFMKSKE